MRLVVQRVNDILPRPYGRSFREDDISGSICPTSLRYGFSRNCYKASVAIVGENRVVGEVDKGLLVLVGVGEGDNLKDAEIMAEKLVKLRILADDKDKMNLSIKDIDGGILAVSQFTLYADTTGGNRPSFVKAAKPDDASKIYNHFIEHLKSLGAKVSTGEFGSYMKINAELDGPVTIIV